MTNPGNRKVKMGLIIKLYLIILGSTILLFVGTSVYLIVINIRLFLIKRKRKREGREVKYGEEESFKVPRN